MYKTKRALSVFIALLVLFSVTISGCGTAKTEAPGTTTSGEATQAESTAPADVAAESTVPADPYEITWYILGNGPQKDNAAVEQEIAKYLKDKINASVKMICLDWGTYEAKMQAIIASAQPYDIAFTASWWNKYIENSRKGAFVDITTMMDQYAPKTKALLGEDFLKGSQVDGKNYGIPCNKEKARNYGFIYNKTLADKYGFDMSNIKSYPDMEPMLKVIKEKEPTIVPIIEGPPIALIPFNATNIADVGLIDENGKYFNQYASPEFKEGYDLARKYYQAGYYKKDVAVMKDADAIKSNGGFFTYIVNMKPGFADEQNTKNKQKGFEVAQIDITPPVITNSETMGSLQAISTTSKNPERALMFLELVNTDKYLNNLINFGIENTHYTKESDNVIKLVDNSGYTPNMMWMYGNQMINYLLPTENPKKWENFEAYNKAAKPFADLGFIFDQAPVATQKAATDNVVKEYKDVLRYGAVDPATYLPKFLDKLKAAGADDIVAEKQKQFDAWKAANGK